MDLKPCPFCGSEGKEYKGYGEGKCGCYNPKCFMYCHGVEKESWNTRIECPHWDAAERECAD